MLALEVVSGHVVQGLQAPGCRTTLSRRPRRITLVLTMLIITISIVIRMMMIIMRITIIILLKIKIMINNRDTKNNGLQFVLSKFGPAGCHHTKVVLTVAIIVFT